MRAPLLLTRFFVCMLPVCSEWHSQSSRTETINRGPEQPAEVRTIPQIHRHRGKRHFFQNQMRIYNSWIATHRHMRICTIYLRHILFVAVCCLYVICAVCAVQGGCLMPGSYTFPFQYQLPDGIPGSFFETGPMPPVQPGTEWIDDNAYGEMFFDSDDELPAFQAGWVRRHTLHRGCCLWWLC